MNIVIEISSQGGSQECFGCQNISTDPIVMILVPLEKGGSRGHFELLYIKIHLRSSEISSLDFGKVCDF